MKISHWLPALVAFILLTFLFELLSSFAILNSNLFPPPSQVLQVLWELRQEFIAAFFETALSVLLGFLISTFLGLGIAILFSLNTYLRKSILPFAIFFQTVPMIAIAPLLVIYFGFGRPTVIAAAAIVCIFPIIANTLIGLETLDKNQSDLFKIYKASKWQTLIRLQLPSAYLSTYTGLRVAAGLSVIGAVAGEFVAGGGLGALIDSARTQQRIDIVFAALILLSILGLLLIFLIQCLNWGLQKWRPLALNLKGVL